MFYNIPFFLSLLTSFLFFVFFGFWHISKPFFIFFFLFPLSCFPCLSATAFFFWLFLWFSFIFSSSSTFPSLVLGIFRKGHHECQCSFLLLLRIPSLALRRRLVFLPRFSTTRESVGRLGLQSRVECQCAGSQFLCPSAPKY